MQRWASHFSEAMIVLPHLWCAAACNCSDVWLRVATMGCSVIHPLSSSSGSWYFQHRQLMTEKCAPSLWYFFFLQFGHYALHSDRQQTKIMAFSMIFDENHSWESRAPNLLCGLVIILIFCVYFHSCGFSWRFFLSRILLDRCFDRLATTDQPAPVAPQLRFFRTWSVVVPSTSCSSFWALWWTASSLWHSLPYSPLRSVIMIV